MKSKLILSENEKNSLLAPGNSFPLPLSKQHSIIDTDFIAWSSLVAQLVKNLPAMQETWVRSLGWEDPLEKGKAAYSSILAWRMPWTLQSMGSQRVGHD